MKTPTTKTPTTPRQIAQATPKPRHPRIVRKPTLSRQDVAKAIGARLKLSDNRAQAALAAVLDAIKQAVRQGHAVELRGFCKFEAVNRKACSRVNMADVKAGKKGAEVRRLLVPAHAVVKATASPVFLSGGRK